MAIQVDPNAFTNAFNAERDRGARQQAYNDQQAQLARQNARQDTAVPSLGQANGLCSP